LEKKILIVDDEENMRHMLSALLAGEGYRTELAPDGESALKALVKGKYDFILCDIKMPVMDGLSFLKQVGSFENPPPIIMMSAFGSVDTAIQAMKLGAYDYISKPFKTDEVILVLKKADERERLRQENAQLKKTIANIERPVGLKAMIGKSKVMQDLFLLADKVAHHSTTVLITGESGTGKELVARGIHQQSPRADKRFVAVNCGSIPENLLESEFFGYVRGAFTGADKDRKGLFEEADNGTLFLDEIGELPPGMQVKLLRVLQEREIRRLGDARNRKVNVRIIAATARNLEEAVLREQFREDLLYRLNVINLHVPPLRERLEDIPFLCDYFLEKYTARLCLHNVQGVSPAAMKLLMQYDWPGNVRELENMIERAIILAETELILPENLPDCLCNHGGDRRLDDFLGTLSIRKGRKILEARLIARALDATDGNKSKAAELLEISYPSLLSKIKSYKII